MAGAAQIASLFVSIGADLQPLSKGLGQAQGTIQRSGGRITSILGGIGTAAAGLAVAGVGGVAALGGGILALARQAAPLEGVRNSFDNLTQSIGQGSDETLKALQEASKGMITDTDLMKSFNEAVMLTGDTMGTEFPRLMEIAQASAVATGQDMGFMLDSLVKGIGRASPMILDNLGLTIDLSEAYDAYATSLGKTAADLTKAEQQQAILNAVVAQGDELIGKLGGEMGGSEMAMAQLNTTIGNLKDSLGTAFLPALEAILTPLASLAQEHGPAIQAWATQFGGWLVEEGIPKLFEFGGAVIAFGKDVHTWITETAIPAWNEFSEALEPIITDVTTWLGENVPVAMQAISDFWDETLYPALQDFWEFLRDDIIPFVEALTGVITELVNIGFTVLRAILVEKVIPALEDLAEWLKPKLEPAVEWIQEQLGKLSGEDGVFGKVKKAIGWVTDRLNELKTALEGFTLPDWLQPGSATPFELGLRGITSAAREAAAAMGGLSMPDGGFGGLSPAMAGAGAGPPTIIVVNLDRREFEGPDGELDYLMLGDRIMGERLY